MNADFLGGAPTGAGGGAPGFASIVAEDGSASRFTSSSFAVALEVMIGRGVGVTRGAGVGVRAAGTGVVPGNGVRATTGRVPGTRVRAAETGVEPGNGVRAAAGVSAGRTPGTGVLAVAGACCCPEIGVRAGIGVGVWANAVAENRKNRPAQNAGDTL